MMARLFAAIALLLVSASTNALAKPQDFEAHLFCAHSSAKTNTNIHYLHPLRASTVNPIDPKHPPRIDFNESSSEPLFKTGRQGWYAEVLHSERRNFPLFDWNTDQANQLFSLNLTNHLLTFDWIFSTAVGIEQRLTYLSTIDQYWGFAGSNNYNGSADTFVLSIYGDVINPNFDGTPVFNVTWEPSTTNLIETWDITSDSENKLIFIAVAEAAYSDSVGLLMTYDIAENQLVSNVTYGAEMRIKYSATRKALFAAQCEDNSDGTQQRISSIEEVDPMTGKSRVILSSKDLPQQYGMSLDNTFDDQSGEWYFVWTIVDENFDTTTTFFFSINIDTKKVTQSTQLLYDWQSTVYLGLVIKDSTPKQQVESPSSNRFQSRFD